MNYILRRASDDPLRRILRHIIGPTFWATYKFPWMSHVVITYPASEMYPWVSPILQHELHHVRQFSRWWGPWLIPLTVTLFPLPVFFSGRWFVERRAYLADIQAGRYTVDEAVNALWSGYLAPWPRGLMRAWFLKHTT